MRMRTQKQLMLLIVSSVYNGGAGENNKICEYKGSSWLHKRSLLFDALIDFDAYLQYVEFDREPSKRFYSSPQDY